MKQGTKSKTKGGKRRGQIDQLASAVAREVDWRELAHTVMWYARGPHSQKQLARLLGYRSNVASAWELRRRVPTARQLLRIVDALGGDVIGVMADFAPALVSQLRGRTAATIDLGSWLDGLRRDISIGALARASGLSRHRIGRYLRGEVSPKLADFMLLVQLATGRLYELMSELVAGSVPPQLGELKHLRRKISLRGDGCPDILRAS